MQNSQPRSLKNLLWLASYPKSGNTWVRAVLTAYLTDRPGAFDFTEMDAFTASESLYRFCVAKSGQPREQLDDAKIDSLRRDVQQLLAEREERPFWIKTHNANLLRQGRRLIDPEFTWAAIYVVRNPLDVVDSLADSCGRTLDEAIAYLSDPRHALGGPADKHVKQYLGTWSQHVRSWIEETSFPVLLLRYEDLHANGAASFKRLLHFLDWPFDAARLQRALARTAFRKLQVAEQEHGFTERNRASRSGRFFRRGQPFAWSGVLNRKQADLILSCHARTMQLVGYPIPDLDAVYGGSSNPSLPVELAART